MRITLNAVQCFTNESIVKKPYFRKSPLAPLACLIGRKKTAKKGKFLPFAKGGKEGLEDRCLDIMD
jgi:hypothetical protein